MENTTPLRLTVDEIEFLVIALAEHLDPLELWRDPFTPEMRLSTYRKLVGLLNHQVINPDIPVELNKVSSRRCLDVGAHPSAELR